MIRVITDAGKIPADLHQIYDGKTMRYLNTSFFQESDACLLVLTETGISRSVLRMEPYSSGWLISGVETAPECRRKGYALELLHSAIERAGEKPVFSHVSKTNAASMALHRKAGFRQGADFARLLDGTVSGRFVTFEYLKNKN